MSKDYDEGYLIGIDHGYSSANYVDAYGGSVGSADERLTDRTVSDAYRSGYSTGWDEGIERFENDQWPDGSPRDED
jgi:hypothetical protein